tara:strand:+ start:434 stop:562 length:129 start_codon:yes stop_codon:yes gene_type:complete
MRYIFGTFMLYCVGWLGGDVLFSAIFIGVAYGFIDNMRGRVG